MCIIIHNKPKSRKLTQEEFSQAWNRNPHGFGIMWVKDSIVESKKTLDKELAFTMYNSVMDMNPDASVVSHFRFATHGSVNVANTHPFECGLDSSGGTMKLVHNGVLGYTSKNYPDMSDTRIFCEMLKRLPQGYTELDEYKSMINKQLSWDKVLIMDSYGEVHYFGQKGLEMGDGIWASNGGATIYKSKYTKQTEIVKLDKPKTSKKKIPMDLKPYVGQFLKVPSQEDETDDYLFYNGVLYGRDYMVGEDGIVYELDDNTDIK